MKAFAAGTGVVMATSALGWYALLQYKEIQLKEVPDFKSLYVSRAFFLRELPGGGAGLG